MYHGGLILEGGGMRGVYTAGVLDAFLEKDIKFEKNHIFPSGGAPFGRLRPRRPGGGSGRPPGGGNPVPPV